MEQLGRYLLCFFILLVCAASTGWAEPAQALRTLGRNPFDFTTIKPPEKSEPINDFEERADFFELRATLIAGDGSLANLNGKIMLVGDEIEGYRLQKIGEMEVLLEKEGEQITVYLKK